MPWSEALYPWVIHSAIVSLLVLAVGSGAVLLTRQPARRVWMVELTLVGCLIAPWLCVIPGYPRSGVGWRATAVSDREEATLTASAERQVEPAVPASDDLPDSPPILPREAVTETAKTPVLRFDGASWIVAVYGLGVVIGLGWWLVGVTGLARIIWTAQPAPRRCREILAEIAGRRADRVKLLVSERVRQPFASAWRQPMIVLPEGLCGDEQALRWSLAHEWAHVEGHDFRMWLLAGLVRVLFFYNPLVWWLRRQLRLCQDFLADAHAARQTPQPEDYAEFLTAVARSSYPAAVALGIGSCRSELHRRVVMLIEKPMMESRAPRLWTVSVTCAALVLVSVAATLSIAPQAAAHVETDKKSGTDSRPAAKAQADANTVRGKVTDDSGKPVAGADVWLPLGLRGVGHVHTSQAKSDAQGQFALRVPPDWLVKSQPWDRAATTVWAYAPGRQFSTARVMLPGGASDVVIQLGPATDTSFVVLGPESQPCAGALVEPYFIRTTLGLQPLPEELMARVAARTDGEGRVKLPAAARDVLFEVRITTKVFGIQVQRTETSEPPAVVGGTIHLRHVGKIEGRVIASEPEIARGVRLIFTTEEYSGKSPPWLTGGHADVKSDENGRFIVPALAEGVVRIDISMNENQPLRPKLEQLVRLGAGETISLGIPMVRTVTVRGSVRAKDTGKPIPGALLHIYYGYYGAIRQGADPVTDAQGNYTARVLPGRVGIQVISMPEEYAELGEPWNRPIEVPNVEVFDLPPVEVVPARSIQGRLIDERDQPVSNAGICVVEGNRRYGHGTSDDKGQFSVAGVPATIDPAKVRYQCFMPHTGGPRECEMLQANPLILRAFPRHSQRGSKLKAVDADSGRHALAIRAEPRKDSLLKERRDTLRQLAQDVEQCYRAGRATLDSLIRASNLLLEAELDLAKTKAERIAIYEKLVANLRQLEKAAEARHQAGAPGGGVSEVLSAKADRLKAEIQLAREKEGDK